MCVGRDGLHFRSRRKVGRAAAPPCADEALVSAVDREAPETRRSRLRTTERLTANPKRRSPNPTPLTLSVGLPLDDRRVVPSVARGPVAAETAPRGPERERNEKADDPDHEQDDARGVDVETGRRRVYRPDQDGPDGRKYQGCADTHVHSPPFVEHDLELPDRSNECPQSGPLN